jgi:MipA family protein
MRMKHNQLISLATCGIATCISAAAQDIGIPTDIPMQKPFELTVGLGLTHRPAYLGSDDRKTAALPLVSARWSNGFFAGTTGIGYQFPSTGAFSGGLRLGFDPGRKAEDSTDLTGMGDIKTRATFGAFASYRIQPNLALGSSLSYGSGNDKKGMLLDMSLRSQMSLGGPHRLFGSAGLTFANQAAMQSQFGVSADQSLSSGYGIYTTGAGLRDVNLNVGYGYALNPNTSLQLGLNLRSLQGDAKNSPLTRSGSGASLNMGLIYRM